MKAEILNDGSLFVTCTCGETHRFCFNFRDKDGNDIKELLNLTARYEPLIKYQERYGTSQ